MAIVIITLVIIIFKENKSKHNKDVIFSVFPSLKNLDGKPDCIGRAKIFIC